MGRSDLWHRAGRADLFRKITFGAAAGRSCSPGRDDSKPSPIHAFQSIGVFGKEKGGYPQPTGTLQLPGQGGIRSGALQAGRIPPPLTGSVINDRGSGGADKLTE